MPHGHCYLWNAGLVWTMVATDLLIGLAYLSISFSLYTLVRRIKVPFHAVFAAFGLFIFACGLTHFMEVYTLWTPSYWLAAFVKVVTATTSVATALSLHPLKPKIVAFAELAKLSERRRIDLAERLDQLTKTQERYRHLVDAVKDYAIVLLDEKGLVEVWNEGARRLEQYEAEEIVGRHFSVFYPVERVRAAQPERDLSEARASGAYQGEGWRLRRDGTPFWASVVITAIQDPGGRVTGFSKVTRDLTERREAEDRLKAANASLERRVQVRTEQLAESESQFRIFADRMPQLAWVAGADGSIFWYNKRWLEYTGKTLGETLGWGWRSVHDPIELPRVMSEWTAALREGRPVEMKYPLKGADGRFRWFLMQASPLRSAKGDVVRWIGTNTDITSEFEAKEALSRNEERFRQIAEQAEGASQLKSSFLANMSHEIRTPLGVLIGFADLMADPGLSAEDRAQFAETLRRNGLQLSRLIDDILDLSKVEAGHLKVEAIGFSVRRLVAEVLSEMNVRAAEKGLRLSSTVEGSVDDRATSDPTRIRQILFNVIGNAIKFTSAGGVDVSVASDGGRLDFDVRDSGTGIPPDVRAGLFRPFHQADETITRKFGGTGLGLALSRRLAQLLGGDLVLKESREGEGSTFTLSISGHLLLGGRESTDAGPPKSAPAILERLDGVTVLLVEDSPDNRTLISRILIGAGAEVEFAADGSEGLEMALLGAHDVVLMDLQMPVLDGFTATQKLRDAGFRKPIIALTAHAMSEVRERCLSVGFTDYLSKPLNKRSLIQAVAGRSGRLGGTLRSPEGAVQDSMP